MVDKERLLDKVIELYEKSCSSNGVCVYKNLEVCDSELPSIWIEEDVLYFEFGEKDIEDFSYYISDIEEIKIDDSDDIVMSIIKINNGDQIFIHNL